jgi:hypothetical protein
VAGAAVFYSHHQGTPADSAPNGDTEKTRARRRFMAGFPPDAEPPASNIKRARLRIAVTGPRAGWTPPDGEGLRFGFRCGPAGGRDEGSRNQESGFAPHVSGRC